MSFPQLSGQAQCFTFSAPSLEKHLLSSKITPAMQAPTPKHHSQNQLTHQPFI